MAQLVPLPLTVSCFSKTQIGFTFLVPAHLGSRLVGHQEEHMSYKNSVILSGLDCLFKHSASICTWCSWCHQHTAISCFIKVRMVYFFGLPGCVAGRCGLCVLLLFLLFYASNCSVDEAGCIIFWGCPSISVHMCILRQRNSPAGNPGFFQETQPGVFIG